MICPLTPRIRFPLPFGDCRIIGATLRTVFGIPAAALERIFAYRAFEIYSIAAVKLRAFLAVQNLFASLSTVFMNSANPILLFQTVDSLLSDIRQTGFVTPPLLFLLW
jgi:hypothetical protein